MFTGIVKGTARIVSTDKQLNFRTHTLMMPDYMLDGLETGASVSQNGCCLTVTRINGNYISFDLIKETLLITNLSELVPGDIVNIERAVKFGDEIGGHLMSGHIITTAELINISSSGNNCQIWFKLQNLSLMKYLFYKGFIGVDGISLTIGEIKLDSFCVNLIPDTIKRTTLRTKRLGQNLNIEIDPQTQATVDTVERTLAKLK